MSKSLKARKKARAGSRELAVCLVSLGCPKNLVDSEVIAGRLGLHPFLLVRDPEEADAVVVNTCGFLEAAKQESLQTLRAVVELKGRARLKAVVAVGCLVQRFRDSVESWLPGVDAFLPISDYSGLPDLLRRLCEGRPAVGREPGGERRNERTDLHRALLTARHVAYLRIAEGCNHRCAFCAIPGIRGKLKSKPLDVLAEEAQGLADVGVKEVILVAEDTTDYGRDLAGESLLPRLLGTLSLVRGLRWIRILYAYPTRVTPDLVNEMARNPKVVPYLDMPIQHISSRILRSMLRGTSPGRIRRTIEHLRAKVPGIAIRTSVILGYPGETEEEFESLLSFLETVRFERLGAFLFSPEPGTAAAGLSPQVPQEVAADRLERVMTLQREIVIARNKDLVGRVEEVIVDGLFDGRWLGRTRADAPDIDCSVRIESPRPLRAGAFIRARVLGWEDYDLIAAP